MALLKQHSLNQHFLKWILAAGCTAVLCGLGAEHATAQAGRTEVAATGNTHALIVFVRFKDDENIGRECLDYRGWRYEPDSDQLPSYAHAIMSSARRPPFADSSLTAYFYEQSDHQFVFSADVYPEVITTREKTAYYGRAAKRGYGYLTAEILERIDADVDFRRYDTNPQDGILDQIFIVLRRDRAATFTGVADLAGADAVRGRPRESLVFDGVKVEWARSGSFIVHNRGGHIISQSYMVRLFAHEFGHHLWNSRRIFPSHVVPITGNDIPENDSKMVGYALMVGRGGGPDARGDLLISGPERDALGWASPTILKPLEGEPRRITLGDAYASRELVRIDAGGPVDGYEVSYYLANRQRVGWFDQLRHHRGGRDCRLLEMGFLRTTGMLVMMTERRGSSLSMDVLAADNNLTLSLENDAYAGDLFGPETSTQLTPWTRPSTAMPDGTPTWFAIDDIGGPVGDNQVISFTFVPDFRKNAVVRSDSWIDDRFDGQVISDGLRVMDGATLELDAATLRVKGASVIAAKSSLNVGITGAIRFDDLTLIEGAEIEVAGELRIDGLLRMERDSQIRASPGSTITADGVTRFIFVPLTIDG